MHQNTLSPKTIACLSFLHIILIILSNILVQYPFDILGFHTTWGAFTYPAIFILTDLTTRLANAHEARKIVFRSMLPGLFFSYFIASYIEVVEGISWSNLFVIHLVPLRIAIACFIAYAIGQLLDILVFQRYRNNNAWWVAPTFSTSLGNVLDTLLFFSIAFYNSTNPFLSAHWPEIAMVDIFFKVGISLLAFVPIYGLVLRALGTRSHRVKPLVRFRFRPLRHKS